MPIWIIRHAESQSNAGLPTTGPYDNGLSELGYVQAKCIPDVIQQPPDLIVTSPYLRTQLTAQPLRNQYSQVPVDVWQVQEFTYLTFPIGQLTTSEMRRPLSQAYWERCDPHYVDGENAESFIQLMVRVRNALTQMHQQTGFVVIFTHGLFIKALLWQILAAPTVINSVAMHRFHGFWRGFRVPNASILKMEFGSDGTPYWSSFFTTHLPASLQTAAPDTTAVIPGSSLNAGIEAGDQPS